MGAEPQDLRGAKVVVTGADGFIGSHLVERLVLEGAEVTALAQYNSFNFWGWLERIDCLSEVRVETGDVRDPNFCRLLVKGADIVFHLAALIPIPYSYRAPDSYFDTNVKGTLNLCQAARDEGVRRFIHTSTSEVYGSARYVPIDESHPLTPQSPYSASKIAADAVALSFFYSFEMPVVVARPFNTFGPRQSARAIIPTIITQLAAGHEEILLGDLTTTRSQGDGALRPFPRGDGGLRPLGEPPGSSRQGFHHHATLVIAAYGSWWPKGAASPSARAGRLDLLASKPPPDSRARGNRGASAEVEGNIDCRDSEKDYRMADPAAAMLPFLRRHTFMTQ